MGETGADGEPAPAGFLADAVWFLYVSCVLGILGGVFSASVYWTFNLLT
jgi:hypothetical protein